MLSKTSTKLGLAMLAAVLPALAEPAPQIPAGLTSLLPALESALPDVESELPALESELPQLIQHEGGAVLDQLSGVIATVAPTARVSDTSADGAVITAAANALASDVAGAIAAIPTGVLPAAVLSDIKALVPELKQEAEAEESAGLNLLPASFALSALPSFLSQYLTSAEGFAATELPGLLSELGVTATAGAPVPTANTSVITPYVNATAATTSTNAPAATAGSPSPSQKIAASAAPVLSAWSIEAVVLIAFGGFVALL